MSSFQTRVQRAQKTAGFTVWDLHTWFDRPYATVWNWTKSGLQPQPGRKASHQSKKVSAAGKKAEQDLERLEKALTLKIVPLPEVRSERQRSDYVRNAYNAAGRARVPQNGSAK